MSLLIPTSFFRKRASPVTAGSNSHSMVFDGSSNLLLLDEDQSGLNFTGGTMTLAMWVKFDSFPESGFHTIAAKHRYNSNWQNPSGEGWRFQYNWVSGTGKVLTLEVIDPDGDTTESVRWFVDGFSDPSKALSVDTWYHLLMVYDVNQTFGVDDGYPKFRLEVSEVGGSAVDYQSEQRATTSDNSISALYDAPADVTVGSLEGDYSETGPIQFFQGGKMDDIRMYSRNVSNAENTQSWREGEVDPANETGLELYLKGNNDFTDSTSNNNDFSQGDGAVTFSTDIPF